MLNKSLNIPFLVQISHKMLQLGRWRGMPHRVPGRDPGRDPRRVLGGRGGRRGQTGSTCPARPPEKEFFIDNLLVRIHLIIEMILVGRCLRNGDLNPLSSKPYIYLLAWSA